MPAESAVEALARADAELLESLRAGDLERSLAGAAAREAILARIAAAPPAGASLAAARAAADALLHAAQAERDRAAGELDAVRAARRLRARVTATDRAEPRFVSRRA